MYFQFLASHIWCVIRNSKLDTKHGNLKTDTLNPYRIDILKMQKIILENWHSKNVFLLLKLEFILLFWKLLLNLTLQSMDATYNSKPSIAFYSLESIQKNFFLHK